VRIPIYVQIQDYIRKGIASGLFAPGERLPSEPDLAQRFGTTRSTVAKAFQQLVFEGVISRRMGSGTFVGSGRFEDKVDTNKVASFEDHVIAAGDTLEYRLIEYAPATAAPEIAEALELEAGAPLYRLERLRSVNGRPVAIETRYIPRAVGKDIDEEWLKVCTIQDVLRDRLGLQISRIENTIGAATAISSVARLLGLKTGAALLVREHVIYGLQGRPLLKGRTVYPSDFRIRYTLRATP